MSATAATEEIRTEFGEGILDPPLQPARQEECPELRMYAALAGRCEEADGDDAVRVVLLTGSEDLLHQRQRSGGFHELPVTGADSPVMQFLAAISRYSQATRRGGERNGGGDRRDYAPPL